MNFVLDCSVACSFLLEDENSSYADWVLGLFQNQKGLVPSIFLSEITNILFIAKKRLRCNETDIFNLINLLSKLSINIYNFDNIFQMQEVAIMSLKYNLSAYDSSYLYVAKKFNLPLATLDQDLTIAAKNEGLYLNKI